MRICGGYVSAAGGMGSEQELKAESKTAVYYIESSKRVSHGKIQ